MSVDRTCAPNSSGSYDFHNPKTFREKYSRSVFTECRIQSKRSSVRALEEVKVGLSDSPPSSELRTTARGHSVSDTKLRCEVITDFSRLELLSSAWQCLWEADCRAEIFQSPGWAKAWWRAYGQQYTLCSLVVYEKDELVGIMPLVKRGNSAQFLGTPQADYADIICHESRVTEVLTVALDVLVNRVEEWKQCDLKHLAEHSRIVRHYQEIPRRLRRCLHLVRTENYRTIVLRRGREEIFKELLGKHHIRRRQNKLQKAGEVEFRWLETKAETQQYLGDFFRHHVRRRAAIGNESACASAEFCNFLRALVDEIQPSDRLRFAVLELDGHALAWALGFEVNGKFLLYQHTFDVNAWDYSPGEVLLWKLLEYAKKRISREFDFGKGAEAYKNRFTNYDRKTFTVFAERPGLAGLTRGFLRRAQGYGYLTAGNLKQAIQEHRTALRIVRSLRSQTTEILRGVRQAGENKELLNHVFVLTAQVFQKAVWSKSRRDVFVSRSVVDPSAEYPATAKCDQEVSIKVGTLGALVDVALERPDILALSDLPRCRQRLKRGDRVYIAREKSHVTLLSWMVTKAQTDGRMCAPLSSLGRDRPQMFMDECRAASRLDSPASYRELLSFLRLEAASRRAELIIGCCAEPCLLRKELLRQGFLPRSQFVPGE